MTILYYYLNIIYRINSNLNTILYEIYFNLFKNKIFKQTIFYYYIKLNKKRYKNTNKVLVGTEVQTISNFFERTIFV